MGQGGETQLLPAGERAHALWGLGFLPRAEGQLWGALQSLGFLTQLNCGLPVQKRGQIAFMNFHYFR